MRDDALLVLDIGKTNAKLTLVDTDGQVLAEQRRANAVINAAPYPHHDTEGLWDWILTSCRAFAAQAHIGAIVPVTHGATAALVDQAGLVLPVLDYEASLPDVDYAARPPYAETLSPALPAGLNLGRQLVWLALSFPADFARARHILMYPQYWAWRLCGRAAGEATSLGCHTDLWQPLQQRYSSLVTRMGWQPLLPDLAPPWAVLGTLKPHLAQAMGLPVDCAVLSGIHDSNASLLRHLPHSGQQSDGDAARTVLSTGTWVIAAAIGAPLHRLREQADMLANTSALGQPVASMRFMGGREFASLAGADVVPCSAADVARLVEQATLALPCFAEAGGPFAGHAGRIDGPPPQTPQERYALATLYCALMTAYCLEALGAGGPITVEGSFTANPFFGPLLAALRPEQQVSLSDDASGTTSGAWLLRHRGRTLPSTARLVTALTPPGLAAYQQRWLAALPQG